MSIKNLYQQAGNPLIVKLKYRDVRKFMEQLHWSLNQTATLVRTYASLVKMAPTEEHAVELDGMMLQEKRLFVLLEGLYREVRGEDPKVQPVPLSCDTYKGGLQQAIRLEREAIRQYRDTYLLTPSPRVRDLFFYALADGTDHLIGLMLHQQEA